MANMTEYLNRLQEITEQNLSILKALNESFYTKSEHISAMIGSGDNQQLFAIPSFLCLEDKINTLQANFENLVNAPRTGEAAFSFDGDSQLINVKGFSNKPGTIDLGNLSISEFKIDQNDILKDLVTPCPYIKLDLVDLPNDIKEINIKKIIIKNSELRQAIFTGEEPTSAMAYGDVRAKLDLYKEDKDYVEYDTIQRLPLHRAIGYGEYLIEEIVEDKLDDNFKETYVITVDGPLTYTTDDGTIEHYIQIGDELTNYTDTVLLTVTNVDYATQTITAQVKSGMYVSLTSYHDNDAEEFCKLKFRSTVDFDKEKYAKVTLEEDDNCIIFIASINGLNIQSDYSYGLAVDTNLLTCVVDGVAYNYLDYYKNFVNNIGDTLYGITTMINNTINNTSYENFTKITGIKPAVDDVVVKVVNINEHLNDSAKLDNIRSLYSQKKEYQQTLSTIQQQIDDINTILQTNSFEDTNQNRQIYESQLQTLQSQKTETTEYIKSLVNEISQNANDATIPISGAKYRIRGYFDYQKFLADNAIDFTTVVKLHVQYRYRNQDSTVGGLKAIDNNFVFSEWNEAAVPGLIKLPEYGTADNQYHFNYPADTMLDNEISFNQIDIPITQGEKVEIRVKAIYDLGYPFIECTSGWSDNVEVLFPEEFEKNVEVLDIIEENNNEVKRNQLNNILEKNGTITHVNDTVTDQDITYLHKPQSIASGFYTESRRVVPLYDKLQELNNMIVKLNDEVFGINLDQPVIKLSCDSTVMTINSNTKNTFLVTPYNDMVGSLKEEDYGIVQKRIHMDILNPTSHTIKLYSIFPGNFKTQLTGSSRGAVDVSNYSTIYGDGRHGFGYGVPVWCTNYKGIQTTPDGEQREGQGSVFNQRYSQLLYFRLNTPYNNPYATTEQYDARNLPIYDDGNPVMYGDMIVREGGGSPRETTLIGDGGMEVYDQGQYNGIYDKNNLNLGGAYTKGNNNIYPVSMRDVMRKIMQIPDHGSDREVGAGASLYPMIDNFASIQVQGTGDGFEYKSLAPNESLSLDLIFEYKLDTDELDSIEKTVSIDIRTSLYKDPINFEITVKANKDYNVNDEIQLTTAGNVYQPIKTN